MSKNFKDRMVGLIIRRMERAVAKGVGIDRMGNSFILYKGRFQYDFVYKPHATICAKNILLIGESGESNNSLGLDIFQLSDIEDGFMFFDDSTFQSECNQIGRRVMRIAQKRGWCDARGHSVVKDQ